MEPQQGLTLVHIKAIDAERRTFTGMATTPKRDRQGDVVDPMGVKFRNPLPLLFHHDQKQPIGTVTFQRPTEDGVAFEASIAAVDEPGALKDRVDEAWQSVKAGLITAVSIGWRALENGIELMRDGTALLKSIEVVELSLVTIPANAEARILSVKELDQAATGRHSPGAAGTLPVVRAQKGAPAMTIPEQITSFENQRAAKVAAMTALMTKAEGATLDAAQTEEYTTLEREVDSIDVHLPRLRKLEKSLATTATPVVATNTETASNSRGGFTVVEVKANVPKGTAFTRYAVALGVCRGNRMEAAEYAKRWDDSTPEVSLALKAAVNPGTIAEPAWAAPLAVARPMQNEFLELLRPATLLGKIPGLRQIPFNVSVPVQTGGGTYAWVGEGAPKPVGNLQFTSVTLGIAKAAGIIVISEELARISSPSAEAVVRNDMIRGMAQFLDAQFIDPTIAAVANVSPASITNAAQNFGSAGTSQANARTDIGRLISTFITTYQSLDGAVLIMSEANAFALSVALNPLGQPLFPGVSNDGGRVNLIGGIPVITSQAAGNTVALIQPREILYADDGGVNIDVSREASVEMSTTPTSPVAAASVLVSLWQQNLVGLRAERFINWKRGRIPAVVYTNQSYVAS